MRGRARVPETTRTSARLRGNVCLAALSRLPTDEELEVADEFGTDPTRRLEVVQDLAWALMNSPAFLFNR